MSRNLGFEQKRNLAESIDDRQILNNLGGGNIQLDIALFRNNLRNTSELVWKFNNEGSAINGTKFLFPRSVLFVYTNGDKVRVEGVSYFNTAGDPITNTNVPLGNLNLNNTYYVVGLELNVGTQQNQLSFSLSETANGTPITIGSISNSLVFIRNDQVTKENLLNIAKPSIQDSAIGGNNDAFDYNIGINFTDAFDTIEESIGIFNFLRKSKYTSNNSVTSSKQIVIEGSSIIADPAAFNTNQTNLNQVNSPGIYITNPFSNVLNIEKTRAYSTSSNPWAEVDQALATKSQQVNIGDLFFSNGIKFQSIDDVNTESGAATSFTHKIPVLINGVEYFVLLKT